jgi:homocysteine S-methyltransferase
MQAAPASRDNPLRPLLDRQGVIILDGGLASALEASGHRLDSDLWSARALIDDPDAIRAVHRAYLEAGADCVTTAGYQASDAGFGAIGFSEEESTELLLRAVRLAVEAREAFWSDARGRSEGRPGGRLRPFVAASVGPYGAFLADGSEYEGRYGVTRDVLDGFHRRRFQLLAGSEADLLACETIPSLEEAEVLLGILADTPGAWAWISFSCRDGGHICDGTPISVAADLCAGRERVAAVGVNCTAPEYVNEIVECFRVRTALPVVAYPNSGEGWDAEARRWTPRRDGAAAGDAAAWRAAGADVIGGCCRVGPTQIRALRAVLLGGTEECRDG